jgi:energy-coupling factor transporter transmembrane protein EcfT
MTSKSVFVNPIVNFFFYLVFSLSVLASHTFFAVLVHGVFFLLLMYIYQGVLKEVLQKIFPFFLFLPFLGGIYLLVSLILGGQALATVLRGLGLITFRLLVVVTIMTIYLTQNSADSLLTAWRTLWLKLRRPWRNIEDLFLFLEMTLRFFPTFQREWDMVQQTRKALRLHPPRNRLARVRQLVEDLAAFLIFRLRHAEETALAMELRGYGKLIPRGVTKPVPFQAYHVVQLILIAGLFLGIQYLA